MCVRGLRVTPERKKLSIMVCLQVDCGESHSVKEYKQGWSQQEVPETQSQALTTW